MYVYSLGQWLLFFFLYCFLGWVWESCYVSAKRRQWVNRGFLHGPMLPIYGTGAVIILLATIPVRDSLWLVFLLGMLAATALEYVTGAAMEALFKVRYWDYSKQPFNLNGYICLTSSLAWGAFSILLVRFLHPPVEDLVLRLPAFLVDPLAFLLTIAVTVDAVRSFQAAMDLREVLTRLTEENEDLRRLAKRVEVISAFAEEDLRRFRERTEVERLLRQERWEDTRRQIQEAYAKGARRRQAQLEESLRRRTDAKLTALANIQEALEAYRDRLAAARDLTEESLEARRAEVQQLLDRLRDREASIRARTARRYRQSLRILRGNLCRGPGVPAEAGGSPGGGGRRMRKAGAAAPALQSGRWFHTERTSLLFVSPYSNSPSLSEPTILYKQSGTAEGCAALSIRMAAWTCSPQRAGPRGNPESAGCTGHRLRCSPPAPRCRRWVPRRMRPERRRPPAGQTGR